MLNSVILLLCPRFFPADASPSALDGRGIWLAAGLLSDIREDVAVDAAARGFAGESGSVSSSSGGSGVRFTGNVHPNRERKSDACDSSGCTRTGDGEREGGPSDARGATSDLAVSGVFPFTSNEIELCVRVRICLLAVGAGLVRKLCVRSRPDTYESDAELSLRSLGLGPAVFAAGAEAGKGLGDLP